ncbi:MAG: hypothetical protein LBP65_00415 [Puniceicoccales bacterium]|nr:hypothetical protein [Puniceicoccales bacterium]
MAREGTAGMASTTGVNVLGSTKTKSCGAAEQITYVIGNVLFWICCIATLGLAWWLVRGGTNDGNDCISQSDEDFLDKVLLIDAGGIAIQVDSTPLECQQNTCDCVNHCTTEDTRTRSVMDRLIGIAKKNPDMVHQRLVNTNKQLILHCAMQSLDDSVQQKIFLLVDTLAKTSIDRAFDLLEMRDSEGQTLMAKALIYPNDCEKCCWLGLVQKLIETGGDQRAHDVLFDAKNSTDNALCTMLLRSQSVKNTMMSMLKLLSAFPLKDVACIGRLLDLLELRPGHCYYHLVYHATILHCIIWDVSNQDANDPTVKVNEDIFFQIVSKLLDDLARAVNTYGDEGTRERYNDFIARTDNMNHTINDLLTIQAPEKKNGN